MLHGGEVTGEYSEDLMRRSHIVWRSHEALWSKGTTNTEVDNVSAASRPPHIRLNSSVTCKPCHRPKTTALLVDVLNVATLVGTLGERAFFAGSDEKGRSIPYEFILNRGPKRPDMSMPLLNPKS
jgi:hypothetical protein